MSPFALAIIFFLVSLGLFFELNPLLLAVVSALVLLANLAFLAAVGGAWWGMLALVMLGGAIVLMPRRSGEGLLVRRRKRLLPPSEREPLEARYQILGRIGSGGMATVYRAKRKADGLMAALKIPQDRYAHEPRFLRRLHREAEVLKRLDHPNVIKVYEHGKAGETHFIAMELVDGVSLEQLIEQRKLTPELALQILLPVARALKHIHAQGIIHRDIKPSNIMIKREALQKGKVDPSGVRLMDFGIASGREHPKLTHLGSRVGTPTYMSPEQAKSEPLEDKSDIYSLGVVLYEALVGEPPFGGSYGEVVQKHINARPVPPIQKNPKVPPRINDLVMRMLSKNPDERPSIDEVIEALASPPESPPLPEASLFLVLAVDDADTPIRILDPAFRPIKAFGQSPVDDVAIDASGAIWALSYNPGERGGMLTRYTPSGDPIASYGSYGLKLGEFLRPIAITADSAQKVYVLDADNQSITRLDLEGHAEVRFGGAGKGKGSFEDARAMTQSGGSLFVLDYGRREVQRLDENGNYLDRIVLAQGPENPAPRLLTGLGPASDGNVLIYDQDAYRIRKVSPKRALLSSHPLPNHNGTGLALVDLAETPEGVIYAVRRGAKTLFRIEGEKTEAIEIGLPIKAMALWWPDQRP